MSRTIFQALSNVQSDLAKRGISKDQTNAFDKYKFRGIDDVLNAMAPILAEHGVLIIPSVRGTETKQVPTAKGGVQNHSKVTVEYTLYDREGDSITHLAVGESMDRGDKSINKAMTAAFKYFLFQAFCIPLQGDDADSENHEIVADTASLISTKQVVELKELVRVTGDEDAFLGWVGVESITDIKSADFDKCKAALEGKIERMKQATMAQIEVKK